jgi:hypothetical protein
MAYTLKLSNGTILLSLPDQQSDSISTSLTLIGKNVNAYGTDLNDNFVRLMENFAGSSYPNAPLNGQLWFDDTSKQIKVYIKVNQNSGYFKAVGSPFILDTQPTTLATGDFWYDTTTQQMKFKSDSTSTIVIGPQYDSSVGKSGWINEKWATSTGTIATVLSLYSNNKLVGVESDLEFTVASSDPNYSYFVSIGKGYNAVYTATNITFFYGTSTSALSLTDKYGDIVTVDQILTDNTNTILVHPLSIVNNTGTLSLGTNNDIQFSVTTSTNTAKMTIGGQNENFEIKVNPTNATAAAKSSAIHIDGTNNILAIFTTTPITSVQISQDITVAPVSVDVDINGNVLIQGDLVVFGTQTNLKTQDLEVVDKNITLGWTTNSQGDDNFADGGGINLRGTRDKTISWYKSTNSWSFTDNINLIFSTATFKINSIDVLSQSSIFVTTAPNLNTVGALTTTTIANLQIYQTASNETIIGSVIPGGGNITIGDAGTTQVTFANKKLWNVGYPSANLTTTSSYRAQAATVGWVQDNIDIVRNPKFALTIDVTGKADTPLDPNLDNWVIQTLTYLYDPNDPEYAYRAPVDARARVLATKFTTPLQYNVPSEYIDLGVPVSVDKQGVFNAAQVVGYSTAIRATTNIPAATLGIHRCIKQYIVVGTYPSATWVAYVPGGATNNLVWTDSTW